MPPKDIYTWLKGHVDVSRETYDRLCTYNNLLKKWQERINLVSPESIYDSWSRHFLDSLQLIKLIPKDNMHSIMDMGSGAGFPGMALAIATGREVHLVESDTRKTVFLREVGRLTNTPNAKIVNKRVENCGLGTVSVVLSRACSDLTSLLALASGNVSHETICLFHKGRNYANEIQAARETWEFDHEIFPSITDAESAIIKVSHIKKMGL